MNSGWTEDRHPGLQLGNRREPQILGVREACCIGRRYRSWPAGAESAHVGCILGGGVHRQYLGGA